MFNHCCTTENCIGDTHNINVTVTSLWPYSSTKRLARLRTLAEEHNIELIEITPYNIYKPSGAVYGLTFKYKEDSIGHAPNRCPNASTGTDRVF